MEQVFLAILGGVVLLFLALGAAIDMAARIEYAQESFPSLKRLAANKKWRTIVLLATCLFYGGTLYELLEQPSPPPIVNPDPAVKAITPIVQENTELKRELAGYTVRESHNSLRRQVWRLADQIDQFWVAKGKEAPSPTGDQQQQNKNMQKWIDASDHECNGKFKDKILGLTQELEARGVNTKIHGWLDYSVIVIQNQRCLSGEELEEFRELGFHMDARDNRIDIKF